MEEKLIIKGSFIKTNRIYQKLLKSSIIIFIVFCLLSGFIYLVESQNFRSNAKQALKELCFDMYNYYCEKYDSWEDVPKVAMYQEDFARMDTEIEFRDISIDINGKSYYLGDIGKAFFEDHIIDHYDMFNEAPDEMVTPIVKQYQSWYLKHGKAIKMLIAGLIISVIFLLAAIFMSLFFIYNKLLITNQMLYAETTNKHKISIPIKSISAISSISFNGISIITNTGVKKIRLLKNSKEIYDTLSSLIKCNAEQIDVKS